MALFGVLIPFVFPAILATYRALSFFFISGAAVREYCEYHGYGQRLHAFTNFSHFETTATLLLTQ